MRRFQGRQSISRGGRAGVLTVAIAAGSPLVAAASPHAAHPSQRTPVAQGVTYGGLTGQHFPVIVEVSRNQRRVVRVVAAIRLRCTSGAVATVPDGYRRLAISAARRFDGSFGPQTEPNDDGTRTDFEGSMSGAFNAARTKAAGTWQFKVTEHDAAGAVMDTCDSGAVRWSAKA